MPFLPFVYGYPSSSPRAHCTTNKSVPTLCYTSRHGPIYRSMPEGSYQVQSPGFLKIVYCIFILYLNKFVFKPKTTHLLRPLFIKPFPSYFHLVGLLPQDKPAFKTTFSETAPFIFSCLLVTDHPLLRLLFLKLFLPYFHVSKTVLAKDHPTFKTTFSETVPFIFSCS